MNIAQEQGYVAANPFGAYYKLEDGTLFCVAMNEDGSPDLYDDELNEAECEFITESMFEALPAILANTEQSEEDVRVALAQMEILADDEA